MKAVDPPAAAAGGFQAPGRGSRLGAAAAAGCWVPYEPASAYRDTTELRGGSPAWLAGAPMGGSFWGLLLTLPPGYAAPVGGGGGGCGHSREEVRMGVIMAG